MQDIGLISITPYGVSCLWWGRTDSLFCGKATGRQTVHRTVCLDGPFESALPNIQTQKKDQSKRIGLFGVFELNLYFFPNLRGRKIRIYLEPQQLFGFSTTLKPVIFAFELNIYLLKSSFFVKRFEPPLTGNSFMLSCDESIGG